MSAPVVPDHAVLRFLQRGCGFPHETVEDLWCAGVDIEDVRAMISNVVQSGVDNNAEGITWSGLRFMLRGAVVTTVLTREQFYRMHKSLVLRELDKRRQQGVAA